MRIAVWGEDSTISDLINQAPAVDWEKIAHLGDFHSTESDALFCLHDDLALPGNLDYKKPVFVSAVIPTLAELLIPNAIRFNGWPGFLPSAYWEVAGPLTADALEVLKAIGKQPLLCTDEPGFISPRIIAMVINEAYFALEEGVSTKAEIDTAMKLGTNYPYGPFEWADKIGPDKIYQLLAQLAKTDKRYTPAPLLTKTRLFP